jgi:hypothetical protein
MDSRRAFKENPNYLSEGTRVAIEPMPSGISRADVADFLVESIETDTWLGKAVQIGG